jgi:hypothetical protein
MSILRRLEILSSALRHPRVDVTGHPIAERSLWGNTPRGTDFPVVQTRTMLPKRHTLYPDFTMFTGNHNRHRHAPAAGPAWSGMEVICP